MSPAVFRAFSQRRGQFRQRHFNFRRRNCAAFFPIHFHAININMKCALIQRSQLFFPHLKASTVILHEHEIDDADSKNETQMRSHCFFTGWES